MAKLDKTQLVAELYATCANLNTLLSEASVNDLEVQMEILDYLVMGHSVRQKRINMRVLEYIFNVRPVDKGRGNA